MDNSDIIWLYWRVLESFEWLSRDRVCPIWIIEEYWINDFLIEIQGSQTYTHSPWGAHTQFGTTPVWSALKWLKSIQRRNKKRERKVSKSRCKQWPGKCLDQNQLPWYPQSGWKAMSRRRKERRRREKIGVNNCQLHLQLPPWVAHASRLEQYFFLRLSY